jgi:hemoglobin-like flavoprotein
MGSRTQSSWCDEMTTEESTLVRQTWSNLAPLADLVAARFYHRLFAIDPTTRTLFENTDLSDQHRKLVKALTVVVQGLDRLEMITPILSDLGRRHIGFGVTERHYDSVGTALLWALEQTLDSEWTSAVSDAWSRAYALVADIMRGRTIV